MTLALQTADGRHLGAVLFEPGAEEEGDCMVMPMPSDPALLVSAEYRALERFGFREAGELWFVRNAQGIQIMGPEILDLRGTGEATYEGLLAGHTLRAVWIQKSE